MKTLNFSGNSGRLLMIVMVAWAIMGFSSDLNGQNVALLGLYNIEGPDSVAAMTITENPYALSFSNLILNTNDAVLFEYNPTSGELKTSNWGTGFNTSKNIEIQIQRNENQNFKITHVLVNYWNNSVGRELSLRANDIEIIRKETHGVNKTSSTSIGEVWKSTDVDNNITGHTEVIPAIENDDVQSIKIATKINANLNIKKIEIYGFVNYKLYEDFGNLSIVNVAKTNGSTLADYNTITLDAFRFPGWTGSIGNQYAFAVTNERAANLMLGGTATDSAYITSPSIDLSSPYEIMFEYRSRIGAANNGIVNVYDNTGLLWNGLSTATSFTTITTAGFIGSATENITFSVPKSDGSEQVIDNLIIQATTQPALNFALQSTKALGNATKSTSKVFTIPLKAANLTGDVTLSLQSGANFTLSGGTTVTQANAEAGTDLEINFNAPESIGTYTDELTISAAGTIDRIVTLSAISDLGTATQNLTDGSVLINGKQLRINGHSGKKVTIYNLSGSILFVVNRISDSHIFTFPAKGAYLLKLEGDNMVPTTTKVMIK